MTLIGSTMQQSAEPVPAAAIPELARGEIAGLDGLRAFSVLLVMFAHYGFERVIPGGLGVTIFFFISGFLITTLMLRETYSTGGVSIKHFYLRRLIRLQPELWAMLAISSVVGTLYSIWIWPRLIDLAGAVLYFSNYLYLGLLTHNAAGDLRWPHLWSLAVEEHYYLTYPLLFVYMIRKPARFLQALGGIIVLDLAYRLTLSHFGVSDHYLYAATDTRIDSIAYGCLTALSFWFMPSQFVMMARKYGALFGVVAMMLLFGSLVYRDPSFRETWRYSIQGVALSFGFICLYIWPAGAILTRGLDMPALKWLGKMSYGAYLWHLDVAGFLSKLVGITSYDSASAMAAVSATIFSVATFGVAAISFEVLQRPFILLRHRLGSKTNTLPLRPNPV